MFTTLLSQPFHGSGPPSSCGLSAPIDQGGNSSMREDASKKYAKIQDGLESSISLEGRSRITRILSEVHHLSDGEKLLLYLKLPSGPVQDDQNRLTPTSGLPTSNRKEQIEASTWIRSHLEEHGDVCMPKSEVYDEYRQYCEQHELRPLCNADFGKMMKQVFPEINTRRLGQRGQSRYFYGGLRKRLDHTQPTLPEMEISSKSIEMDTNVIDGEIFRSSCHLLCEWADKLLEMKFTSVQEIAEHLILKTFVNTKSVAALTLIAAMQESGKYNMKGSSVFGFQNTGNGDKHRETNLLLARKLQQNKEIQKQKEKAQALREELQQTNPGVNVNPSLAKTPVTNNNNNNRKSVTPSSMVTSVSTSSIKSPRIPSNYSSPLPSQSPQKFQSPRKPVSPWQPPKSSSDLGSQSKNMEQINLEKSREQIVLQSKIVLARDRDKLVTEKQSEVCEVIKINEQKISESSHQNPANLHKNMVDISCDTGNVFVTFKTMETTDMSVTDTIREAVTPELSMDIDQTELSHVRKINFDELGNESSPDDKKKKSPSSSYTTSDDKLSKSAGCLNLKTMLEAKEENKFCLNKSMGFLECSKNALFVNQSTIPGRSAFVPFSQVQSLGKKDNPSSSQSVAMAIPVIIPSTAKTQSSETGSQSTGIAMIAVPTELHTSPAKNPKELMQNETIFNILPTSSLFKPQTSQSSEITLSSSLTDSTLPLFSIPNQTKESINVVSVSSVLSNMSGSECVVSSAQSSQKQMRMKFTPIRPKASPSKAPAPKEQKSEVPAYDKDKRPVSAILKEKRAKEQAEAMAKSIRLSSIPFQPNISLAGSQLGALQAIPAGSANLPSNEVVIIVNNQPMKVQQIVGQNSVVTNSSAVSKATGSQINTSQSQIFGDKLKSQLSNSGVLSQEKSLEKSGSISSDLSLSDEQEMKEIGSVPSDMKELSPMNEERGITPILQESDDTLLLSDAESDANLNINTGSNDKGSNLSSRLSNLMSPGSVDQMWLETPRKIQKLNITSPFQEECSFGRETPIRISKPSDSCSSRPESACSYGRETPSGARKRKSSDFQPRRDIKRLNSTGEDSEDLHNMSLVLSPESDFNIGINPRRTQSCTDELDKDSKFKRQHFVNQQQQRQNLHQLQLQKTNADTLLQGLQSPDIHSLEREALIESFPNSLFAMKPHYKLNKNQSSSIGVNAKSMRQSQQKLLRQQQYLDERVKNFLQTKSEASEDSAQSDGKQPVCKNENEKCTILVAPGNNRNVKSDNLVVSDRGKPYQRPSSVATMSRSSTSDMETSDLPSDVADWINEIMEQRQHKNQSAMSEPDCRKEATLKVAAQLNIQNFSFESDRDVTSTSAVNNRLITSVKNQNEAGSKNSNNLLNDDNNFTVPKAPPVVNIRTKDPARLNSDVTSSGPRCQSLPIFASPVQSPVSPMNLSSQLARNHGNRAASMSPRGQHVDMNMGILSPTNGINSSVRRKEPRENIATGGHIGLIHRDSKQGTYLASIQHSLQKPVDIPSDAGSPLDAALSQVQQVQVQSTSVIFGGKPQSMLLQRSRESSLDIDERYVSQTPFSDSGYHSSGPSPILNSTPVSAIDSADLNLGTGCSLSSMKHTVAESPITMVARHSSPVSQQVLNRPQLINQNQQQIVTMATSKINSFGGNQGQLRSSVHSAFIPIQGSNNIRYVTPIKPSVTLPNNGPEVNSVTNNISDMCNLYIDPNHGIMSTDVTMVSPHSADPPSYEVAIKQLKKSTPPKSSTCGPSDISDISVTLDGANSTNCSEQIISFVSQDSNIFPGPHGNKHRLDRPYSQKLIELSRQTLNVGSDQNNLLSTEILGSDKDVLSLSSMFMIGDEQQQAPPTYPTNQSDSRPDVVELEQNGATTNFDFDHIDSNSMVVRSPHVNVLNIDPSYQSSSQFESTNQAESMFERTNQAESMFESTNQTEAMFESTNQTEAMFESTNQAESIFESTNQTEAVLPTMHHLSSKLNSAESRLLRKSNFTNKSELSDFAQFQPQGDEISIFSNNGAYGNNDNSNNLKNALICGKLNQPGYDLVCESADNKTGENFNQNSQDSMEDIGIPWDSLGEISKDFDFNMI